MNELSQTQTPTDRKGGLVGDTLKGVAGIGCATLMAFSSITKESVKDDFYLRQEATRPAREAFAAKVAAQLASPGCTITLREKHFQSSPGDEEAFIKTCLEAGVTRDNWITCTPGSGDSPITCRKS